MACNQCSALLTPQESSQRLYPAVYTFSHNARPKLDQLIPDLRLEKPNVILPKYNGLDLAEPTWWRTPVSQLDLRSKLMTYDATSCDVCSMFFASVTPSLVSGILDALKDTSKQTYFIYKVTYIAALRNEPAKRSPILTVYFSHGTRSFQIAELLMSIISDRPKVRQIRYLKGQGPKSGTGRTYLTKKVRLDLRASLPGNFLALYDVSGIPQDWLYALSCATLWLQDCISDHGKSCNRASEPFSAPTRLLDLGADHQLQIRVCSPPERVCYMTLSHRWTIHSPKILTEASVADMSKGLDFDTLPKTYQDAIKVTKFLDVQYLWIDSLCIIQDSVTDRQQEIAKMGDIYKFSFCNLAESWPSLKGEGLFCHREAQYALIKTEKLSDQFQFLLNGCQRKLLQNESGAAVSSSPTASRRRRLQEPPEMNSSPRSSKSSVVRPTSKGLSALKEFLRIEPYDNQNFWVNNLDHSPLSLRGWVTQERLLAPRTLFFTRSQFFWECQLCKACERSPSLAFTRRIDTDGMRAHDHVKSNITQKWHDLYSDPLVPFHEHWQEIVERYSDTILTRPEDKLVAIAGIANEVQKVTKDQYCAGLWRTHLLHQLCWRLKVPQKGARLAYRAPSWSWASVDGATEFMVKTAMPQGVPQGVRREEYRDDPLDDEENAFTQVTGYVRDGDELSEIREPLARIVGVHSRGIDSTRWPLGQIGYADVCVRGHLARLVLNTWHVFLDHVDERYTDSSICLPLSLDGQAFNMTKLGLRYLVGLIVEPTSEFDDEYRRIGSFRVEWSLVRSEANLSEHLKQDIKII